MYDEEFFAKANLQSFVNYLFNEMPLAELETDSPKERYDKYMQGISDGLKSFHKAEISDFKLEDYDHGPAASPIWVNVWNLERLHFEMGFRTGAALYGDIPAFKLGPLLDSQHKKGEHKKMDEMEREESVHQQIRGFSDSWYSNMKRRLNLQSIGGMLRDGGEVVVFHNNFQDREQRAHDKLEKEITAMCGADTATKILEKVSEYCLATDTIYFSLGMKAGATLQVKLLDNFETDI